MVTLLDEESRAIAGLGDELGPEEWDLPSECPGWSARDPSPTWWAPSARSSESPARWTVPGLSPVGTVPYREFV